VSTTGCQAERKTINYAVIGCGRVGITWARQLAAIGGKPVGFVSRRRSSARAALEVAGGGRVFEDLGMAVRGADLVLITTPDTQIEATASALAATQALKSGSVVLHCSGALGAEILATVRQGDVHAGSLHPLQSFAAPVQDRNPFQGIVMAAEGDPAAVDLAEDLAGRLAARFIRLPAGTKTLYHAAAVVASNYLVTLMGAALEMLAVSGMKGRDAFEILHPLVQGTLDNIQQLGIPDALTGPIARGDAATVERHCRDLAEHRPSLLQLYRVLGAHTLTIAEARGGDESEQVVKLRALLTDAPGEAGYRGR
jgi:predicted short-subunit dehydrogenase-like oxidoreductase (DUF2520 family)